MDNIEKTTKMKSEVSVTKKLATIIFKLLVNLFLIWGSIGLILLALSIAGIKDLTINVGGFLVYLFGLKVSSVVSVLLVSLSFWWLWLLLGYGMKSAYKHKGEKSLMFAKKPK